MSERTILEEAIAVLKSEAARQALIVDWESRARQQFECAAHTTDPKGKRVMEHGAFVYFNCAQSLKATISLNSAPTTNPIPMPSPGNKGC